MKLPVRIVQVFVGVLFIVSGLVKANDPIGLGYKMQEFFELWNAGFAQGSFVHNALNYLHEASLPLSVFMITLEVLAGAALLLGWKKRFIIWLLLVLIVFFAFLTGYAYLSGKFTNCGCFGDCLPITPLTSFLKDVALLLMILFLLFNQRYITPVFTSRTRTLLLCLSLVLSLVFQGYVLNYLPVADCLPFKRGNNISEQMKPPPGSRPDSVVIKYIYEKGGKRYEWAANELPADFNSYKYVDRIDKVVRKGNADPPIKGFSLVGLSGEDSTQVVLNEPKAVLVFALDVADRRWLNNNAKSFFEKAAPSRLPLYLASTNLPEAKKALAEAGINGVQCFNTDFTVVRTVARTTPTVLFLKRGVVVQKFGRGSMANASEALRSF